MNKNNIGASHNRLDAGRFRFAAGNNGYDLLEIANGEKACKVKGWPTGAAKPRNFSNPRPGYLNTGILCAGLRVVDIDCDDPALVEKLEKLARSCLGNAPLRFRENSPRVAMLYRAAEGAPRKRSVASRSLFNLDGKPSKVEILGAGQFVLAHGVHPSRALLEWEGGSPADTPLAHLPAVTESQIDAFLKTVATLIEAEAPPRGHAVMNGTGSTIDPFGLNGGMTPGSPVSIRRLEIMLDQIGSHASRPFHYYDDWIRLLCLPVAGMIRRGQIDREEAIALIKRVSQKHG